MKSNSNMILFAVICIFLFSCSGIQNITEVTSSTVTSYSLGQDTLNKVQFISPGRDIVLKPTIKSQGILVKKGDLVILNEDIIIPKFSKGVLVPTSDSVRTLSKDSLRISFEEGKSLLFKKNSDGNFALHSDANGLLAYGNKQYRIEGFTKGDRSLILYYVKYLEIRQKTAKGIKIKK